MAHDTARSFTSSRRNQTARFPLPSSDPPIARPCVPRFAITGRRFGRRRGCRADRWAEGNWLELAFVNAGARNADHLLADEREPQSDLTLYQLADLRPRHRRHLPRRRFASRARLPAIAARCAAEGCRRRPISRCGLAAWSCLPAKRRKSVVAVASRTDMILQDCDSSGFETFIATGLKYTRRRSRAAARLLHAGRPAGGAGAGAGGRRADLLPQRAHLKAYATALWGVRRCCAVRWRRRAGRLARRVNISGGVVRVPPVFRGVPKALCRVVSRLRRAATAHVALTRTRFPIGSLKPLQMALIGLVEDARVETLAMRAFPGLRRSVGAVSCRRAVRRDHRADAAWRGWRARCSIRIMPTPTAS